MVCGGRNMGKTKWAESLGPHLTLSEVLDLPKLHDAMRVEKEALPRARRDAVEHDV